MGLKFSIDAAFCPPEELKPGTVHYFRHWCISSCLILCQKELLSPLKGSQCAFQSCFYCYLAVGPITQMSHQQPIRMLYLLSVCFCFMFGYFNPFIFIGVARSYFWWSFNAFRVPVLFLHHILKSKVESTRESFSLTDQSEDTLPRHSVNQELSAPYVHLFSWIQCGARPLNCLQFCMKSRYFTSLLKIFFMTDYNLNLMSWVKSHIWMPWCRGDLIISVWGILGVQGDLVDLISGFSELWVFLTLLTTLMDAKTFDLTGHVTVYKALSSTERKKKSVSFNVATSGNGTLHCRRWSSKMFYSSVGPQKQWNIRLGQLPTLLKQCL